MALGPGRPPLRQPDRCADVRLPVHDRDVDEVGWRRTLLRRGGYLSISQGLRKLTYDIKEMLALGGVTTAGGAA